MLWICRKSFFHKCDMKCHRGTEAHVTSHLLPPLFCWHVAAGDCSPDPFPCFTCHLWRMTCCIFPLDALETFGNIYVWTYYVSHFQHHNQKWARPQTNTWWSIIYATMLINHAYQIWSVSSDSFPSSYLTKMILQHAQWMRRFRFTTQACTRM